MMLIQISSLIIIVVNFATNYASAISKNSDPAPCSSCAGGTSSTPIEQAPGNYYTGDLPPMPPVGNDVGYDEDASSQIFAPSSKLPPDEMPYFVESLSSNNVTVNPGEMAVISCVVRNLGGNIVIWRRADQLVPLTIGHNRHVLDERFTADANSVTGEWSLVIREARLADSGIYRCQINVIQQDGTYLERRVSLRVRDVPLLVIDVREALRSDSLIVTKLSSITSLPRPVLFDLLTTIGHHSKTTVAGNRSSPSKPATIFSTESFTFMKNSATSRPAPGYNTLSAASSSHHYLMTGEKMSSNTLLQSKRGKHLRNNNSNNNKAALIPYYYTLAGDLSIGGTDYVERGQNIELTCNASSISPNNERAPRSVEWFKEGEKVESSRESGYFITKHAVGRTLYSSLIVYKAELKHAGDYVCRVPDLNAVETFKVSVLNVQPGTVKRGTGSLIGHSMTNSDGGGLNSINLLKLNIFLLVSCSISYVV